MKTSQELELLAVRVARLLAKDEKINAIKLVREKTDYGFKESKDFVDHVDRYRERGKKCAMYAAADWCDMCQTNIDECDCTANKQGERDHATAMRELSRAIGEDPLAWQKAVTEFYEKHIRCS